MAVPDKHLADLHRKLQDFRHATVTEHCTVCALPQCGCDLQGKSWCQASAHCYSECDLHWMTDCRGTGTSSPPPPAGTASPPPPSPAPKPPPSPSPPPASNGACSVCALPACGCDLAGKTWCRAEQHCYDTCEPWMTQCGDAPIFSPPPPTPVAASPPPPTPVANSPPPPTPVAASPPPPTPVAASPPPPASSGGGCATSCALPECGCDLSGESWCNAEEHCYATCENWMTRCDQPPPPPTPPTPPASPSPPPTPPMTPRPDYVLPAVPGTYTCGGNAPCGSGSGTPEAPFYGSTGESPASYACMDWSAGSNLWETQQRAYASRGGPDVLFGIGSFESSDVHLGKCFLMQVEGAQAPLLAQVINTGGDVRPGHFDLQQSAGGVGLCNAISPSGTFPDGSRASDSGAPLFAGNGIPDGTWGPTAYGGFQDISGCDTIPEYPDGPMSDHGAAMREAGEKDLRALCREAYAIGTRMNSGVNPTISDVRRVVCPAELYTITGVRRTDEPSGCTDVTPGGCPQESEFSGVVGKLTRMFDACKPSAAWNGNVNSADPQFPHVIGCGPDGITRLTEANK